MPSDRIIERAQDLIEQLRVYPVSETFCLVAGGMLYQVHADESGVHCDCYAGCDSSEPVCCHAIAAMVAWRSYGMTGD